MHRNASRAFLSFCVDVADDEVFAQIVFFYFLGKLSGLYLINVILERCANLDILRRSGWRNLFVVSVTRRLSGFCSK